MVRKKVGIYSRKFRGKKKRRKSRKKHKKNQVGGMVPLLCAPCAAGIASGASVAGVLGAGTALYAVKKRSSMKTVKGKRVIKRHEEYKTIHKGKKKKKTFIQNGRNLILNGKRSKEKTMQAAHKKFNKSVKKCKKSGFKEC